ncbi:MAG TPA: TIM-barrel domain-containing protein [Terriglobales bacterium]|nr:TIM-barrel domain-containing protein [Terriglobales bacterium]
MEPFRNLSWACLLIFCAAASAQWSPRNPVTAVQQQPDGVVLKMGSGTLRVQICTDSIVHVLYSPTAEFPTRPEYVVLKKNWPAVDWKIQKSDEKITILTARLQVTVARIDGSVAYSSVDGRQLMTEANRTMRPVEVNGEHTYHAESFITMYGSSEGLYGLGQHQAGVWNYRGESVDISQDNTNIAVPFMVSSKGYGLFWNNTSRSRFNDRFLHYLYISSEVAEVIDYYFIYGPELDKVIASYRDLTGPAPLFGKWAYGFWQCKNRYKTQDELLGIARKYRELQIPADNIVQDWFWWMRKGEFKFNENYPDPKRMVDELHQQHFHLMISVWPFFEPGSSEYDYMDKQGWFIDKFKFAKPPFHADRMAVYDPSNPDARKYYWNLIDKSLFNIGLDAWWMDTTEPETEGQEENIQLGHKLSIGSGDRYVNLFPLMTTSAVYQGQRAASDQKRVFILSRSAFAGSQRNAVTAWSGDINSDFLSFKRQIPAGLNFALSGLPYWTTDIGGFVSGNPDDPAYRELFVRWFQFGTFCPIFRVHGTRTTNQNELWSYGSDAQRILTAYDSLRYRLMPYIYSLAWKVTHDGYTLMRPLVMDFPANREVVNVGDQFMFGPAILVNPVTEQGATRRRLYLPQGKWFDFWTGASVQGGTSIDADAPLDRLPLYVRAGSILPMGPSLQYATEKPADPIELRIYPGADGDFTIYEDDNDDYDYEQGGYALMPLHWDDGTRKLTIGDRSGQFAFMLKGRSFHVVFVHEARGIGGETTVQPDKTVEYSGKQVIVSE